MKLSKETLDVFKQLAKLNDHLFVESGSNKIKTMTPTRHVWAVAEIKETFPENFTIASLTKFFKMYKLFSDPELEFSDEQFFKIKQGDAEYKYFYTAPSCLVYPKKVPSFEASVEFTMDAAMVSRLVKTIGVTKHTHLKLSYDGDKVRIGITDRKNKLSNEFSYSLDATGEAFEGSMYINVENIEILETDYTVKVLPHKAIGFYADNEKFNIHYVIVAEVR